MPLYLFLCLSVFYKSLFCRNDYTVQDGFYMAASFHLSYSVLYGDSTIYKNKGSCLWKFVLNSGIRKFHHARHIAVTICCQLSSTKVDAQHDKLDCLQSSKLTIPVSCSLVYHTDHPSLSAMRFPGVGSSVTADTCYSWNILSDINGILWCVLCTHFSISVFAICHILIYCNICICGFVNFSYM